MIQEKVQEAFTMHKTDMLTEMESMFNKISENSNTSQLNKISGIVKSSVGQKFKRKSNEEQFKVNESISLKLDEASDSKNLQDAYSKIAEAKNMISHRQKMIRLADSSELGWKLVNEYESNPLASDSDDERRMYKAEARANRKARAEKVKRRSQFRTAPYRRIEPSRTEQGTRQQAQSQQSTRRLPGLCFVCGKPGHWKGSQECSMTNTNNKISTDFCNKTYNTSSENFSGDTKCLEKETKGENISKNKLESTPDFYQKSGIKRDQNKVKSPVGRLKECFTEWENANSSLFIRNVVKEGYRLPFKEVPSRAVLKNNKSARENPVFVQSEIKSLLEKGVISKTENVPHVVNPLTVAYGKSGKPRLVLDCRHINPHLHLFNVKFEDVNVAKDIFENSSFLFTYDLKGAYHHIDIFEEHRTYLGFSYCVDNEESFYVFNSLPFGIRTAGHIFTKLLKVVVTALRKNGHRVVMFLDDGIGGNRDYETAVSSSKYVQNTIQAFGFLFADEKCQWQPTRNVVWLGHVIDMNTNLLFITEERIRTLELKIKSLILQIRLDKYGIVPVRILASVAGQIISMQSVIGNKVRLYTRELFKCINSRASWNAPVRVSEQAVGELFFWKEKVRSLNENGADLKYFRKSDFVLYVDASATGYGSFLEHDNQSSFSSCINADTFSQEAESDGKFSSKNVKIRKTLAIPEVKACVSLALEKEMLSMSPEVDLVAKNSSPEEEGKCNSRNVTIQNTLTFPEAKVYDPPEVERRITHMFPEADTVKKNSCLEAHSVKKVNLGSRKCLKSPCEEIVGEWSLEEQNKSSTWRESEAVYRSMRTLASSLKNSHVTIYSDNKNVKSVLLNGSRKDSLQSISVDFNNICQNENIQANTEWIPRESNTRADFLSRCTDSDGWEICDDIFQMFDLKWERYTIDRFASHLNNKCKRFNSRWWVPGTEAVDALSQNWSRDINWIVPPPRLVVKCLVKTFEENAKCTYIIPKWTSAPYWPLLIDNRGNFKCFVKQNINLSRSHVVKTGNEKHGLFSRCPLSFDMIALNIAV